LPTPVDLRELIVANLQEVISRFRVLQEIDEIKPAALANLPNNDLQ